MKKSLVAVLLALGLATVGGAAFADAYVIDFTTYFNDYIFQNVLSHKPSETTSDLDDNLIPDGAELNLLEVALADATRPDHDAIHTAFTGNLALLNAPLPGTGLPASLPALPAPYTAFSGAPTNMATFLNITGATYSGNLDLTFGTAFVVMYGGIASIGDANKIAEFKSEMVANVAFVWGSYNALAQAVGLTPNMNAFAASFAGWVNGLALSTAAVTSLGTNADYDGDGYDNLTEFQASSSNADYITRTTRVDAPPTFTVTITKNRSGQVAPGTNVTFTAAVANGTAATYVWKKDGAPILGANAVTYTKAVVAADSGSYTCEATDGIAPEAVVSNALALSVIGSTDMPAMGIAGIALLVGLAGALGVRKIRK